MILSHLNMHRANGKLWQNHWLMALLDAPSNRKDCLLAMPLVLRLSEHAVIEYADIRPCPQQQRTYSHDDLRLTDRSHLIKGHCASPEERHIMHAMLAVPPNGQSGRQALIGMTQTVPGIVIYFPKKLFRMNFTALRGLRAAECDRGPGPDDSPNNDAASWRLPLVVSLPSSPGGWAALAAADGAAGLEAASRAGISA